MIEIPDTAVNPAKIAFIREFGWKKVATINEAVEYHSLVSTLNTKEVGCAV